MVEVREVPGPLGPSSAALVSGQPDEFVEQVMAEASWTHRTSFSGITSLFLSMKQFGVMVGRQLLRRKGSHLEVVTVGEEEEKKGPGSVTKLNPAGKLMGYWDLLSAVLLLYTATVTPYEVGFTQTRLNFMFYLNRFVDLLFIIDMGIQFNLPYQEAFGVLQNDRRAIVRNYLRTWFALDFVSVLPYDCIVLLINDDDLSKLKALRLLKQLRLIKLLRMLRSMRVLQRFERRNAINYAMLNFYKYIFLQLIVCHWMACAFITVLETQDSGETWLSTYKFAAANSPAARKYLVCLYTSMATITTLSYGDIFPITDTERCFLLFVMLVGAATYAYIVGGVCDALSSMNASKQRFNSVMDMTNQFLKVHMVGDMDPELTTRLRDYTIFNHKHDVLTKQIASVLDELTESLRGALADEIHRPWLDNTPFFRGISDTHFFVDIALCMKALVRPVREPVFNACDEVDGLYVIEMGIVVIKSKLYRKNCAFGYDTLYRAYQGQTWGYIALPLSHVALHMLPAADLHSILTKKHYVGIARVVRRQVVNYMCSQLLRSLGKVMHAALKCSTFHEGYLLIKARRMHKCNFLVWRFIEMRSSAKNMVAYAKAAVTLQTVSERARLSRRVRYVNSRLRKHVRNMHAIHDMDFLRGLGMLQYANNLYEAGVQSASLIDACTGSELLSMGIPLGDVKRIQLMLPTEEMMFRTKRREEVEAVRAEIALRREDPTRAARMKSPGRKSKGLVFGRLELNNRVAAHVVAVGDDGDTDGCNDDRFVMVALHDAALPCPERVGVRLRVATAQPPSVLSAPTEGDVAVATTEKEAGAGEASAAPVSSEVGEVATTTEARENAVPEQEVESGAPEGRITVALYAPFSLPVVSLGVSIPATPYTVTPRKGKGVSWQDDPPPALPTFSPAPAEREYIKSDDAPPLLRPATMDMQQDELSPAGDAPTEGAAAPAGTAPPCSVVEASAVPMPLKLEHVSLEDLERELAARKVALAPGNGASLIKPSPDIASDGAVDPPPAKLEVAAEGELAESADALVQADDKSGGPVGATALPPAKYEESLDDVAVSGNTDVVTSSVTVEESGECADSNKELTADGEEEALLPASSTESGDDALLVLPVAPCEAAEDKDWVAAWPAAHTKREVSASPVQSAKEALEAEVATLHAALVQKMGMLSALSEAAAAVATNAATPPAAAAANVEGVRDSAEAAPPLGTVLARSNSAPSAMDAATDPSTAAASPALAEATAQTGNSVPAAATVDDAAVPQAGPSPGIEDDAGASEAADSPATEVLSTSQVEATTQQAVQPDDSGPPADEVMEGVTAPAKAEGTADAPPTELEAVAEVEAAEAVDAPVEINDGCDGSAATIEPPPMEHEEARATSPAVGEAAGETADAMAGPATTATPADVARTAEMEEAAVRIQAAQRGCAARQRVAGLRAAESREESPTGEAEEGSALPAGVEGATRALAPVEEETAVVRIQAAYRGHAARRQAGALREIAHTPAMRLEADEEEEVWLPAWPTEREALVAEVPPVALPDVMEDEDWVVAWPRASADTTGVDPVVAAVVVVTADDALQPAVQPPPDASAVQPPTEAALKAAAAADRLSPRVPAEATARPRTKGGTAFRATTEFDVDEALESTCRDSAPPAIAGPAVGYFGEPPVVEVPPAQPGATLSSVTVRPSLGELSAADGDANGEVGLGWRGSSGSGQRGGNTTERSAESASIQLSSFAISPEHPPPLAEGPPPQFRATTEREVARDVLSELNAVADERLGGEYISIGDLCRLRAPLTAEPEEEEDLLEDDLLDLHQLPFWANRNMATHAIPPSHLAPDAGDAGTNWLDEVLTSPSVTSTSVAVEQVQVLQSTSGLSRPLLGVMDVASPGATIKSYLESSLSPVGQQGSTRLGSARPFFIDTRQPNRQPTLDGPGSPSL